MPVTYDRNDLLIMNDQDTQPAAIISSQSLAIASFVTPFPFGESGVALQDGTLCVQDGQITGAARSVALYQNDLTTRIATVDFTPLEIHDGGICSDVYTHFYVTFRNDGSDCSVKKLDTTGAVLQTWHIVDGALPGPCVSRDGHTLYYIDPFGSKIKAYSLQSSTALPDLHAAIAGEFPVEGLVDSGGNIWYSYKKPGTSPAEVNLRQFDTAGTILQTIKISDSTYITGGRTHINGFDTGIWTWLDDGGSGTFNSEFVEVLYDGSVNNTIPGIVTIDTNSGTSGISNSCPLIALGVAPGTGTLIVTKVTDPPADPQTFNFTAGGGLSPTTFSLQDGDTQTYFDVPVGSGYSIAETPVMGWATGYSVSNGSPVDNITIADGETVTVTVTNTQGSSGTLIVRKVVTPTNTDTFTVHVGGVIPSTLTLGDGDSHTYTVAPGSGYSVSEDPVTGYSTVIGVSNGSPADNITVAEDETVTVVVTNAQSQNFPLVRERIFQIPVTMNLNEFIQRIEIFMQSGVGNSDAPNPSLRISLSKDGGQTYAISRTVAIGQAGAFMQRVFSLNWGKARNPVCKICTSDPVFIGLLECYVDIEAGTY